MKKGKASHPLVQLAVQSVEAYIKEGRHINPPDTLTPEMKEKAGVFVCLKKGGTEYWVDVHPYSMSYNLTIIEVAAIELNGRSVSDRSFHRYINPEREIDAGAAEVHGLTLERLQQQLRELGPRRVWALRQQQPR